MILKLLKRLSSSGRWGLLFSGIASSGAFKMIVEIDLDGDGRIKKRLAFDQSFCNSIVFLETPHYYYLS